MNNQKMLEALTRNGMIVKATCITLDGTFSVKASIHEWAPTTKKVLNYKLVDEVTADNIDRALQVLCERRGIKWQ